MGEGKWKLIAMIGTIALHIGVVWFLASSPEATARMLRALPMDVVDLTPPPEPEPEPEPEVEEPEPEPPPPEPPQKRPRRRRPRKQPPRPQKEPPREDPPSEEPPEEPPSEEPPSEEPPPVIDFGEANMAAAGAGTGWSLQASHGGSGVGLYRPGQRGGRGTGRGGSGGSGTGGSGGTGFHPVPRSRLARPAEPVGGRLNLSYPPEARRQMIEGVARVAVEIRATGAVRNVRILSDPGAGLGPACAAAVRRARWRPARDREGHTVDSRIVYACRFLLDDF